MTRLDLARHPLYNLDIDTVLMQFAECRSTLIQTSETKTVLRLLSHTRSIDSFCAFAFSRLTSREPLHTPKLNDQDVDTLTIAYSTSHALILAPSTSLKSLP